MQGQESLLLRALVFPKEKQVCTLKSIHAFWKHEWLRYSVYCQVNISTNGNKVYNKIDLFKNQFKSSCYSIHIFGRFVCLLLLKIKEGDGHREAK